MFNSSDCNISEEYLVIPSEEKKTTYKSLKKCNEMAKQGSLKVKYKTAKNIISQKNQQST